MIAVACGNDDDDSPGVTAGTAAPAPAQEPSDEGPSDEGPSDEGPADEGPADEGPAEEAPAPAPEEPEEVTIEESVEVEAGPVPTGNVGHSGGGILSTVCSDGRPTGGTLTMGMFGEITGWDPTLIQGGASLGGTQMVALYGALFYLDLTTGQLVPGLAESISTDDNQVFTLKLRDGITFTDGTTLDAEWASSVGGCS